MQLCDNKYAYKRHSVDDFPLLKTPLITEPHFYTVGKFNPDMVKNSVGVIGSRRLSNYGRVVTTRFVKSLAELNIPVVSGFMYGADLLAHKTSLENNNYTVGILGWGVSYLPGSQYKDIYNAICQDGCLLSFYEPNFSGAKWSFVKRNKYLASIVKTLIVIEAGENSGTVETAKHMFAQNKKVFIVAANINSPGCAGLKTIAKLGGNDTEIIFDIEPVIKYLGMSKTARNTVVVNIKGETLLSIYRMLQEFPYSFDDLAEKLSIETKLLAICLSNLELENHIYYERGNYYVK